MKKVEALPYKVDEAITKIVKGLTDMGIDFYQSGREIYVNEDIILNREQKGNDKPIIKKIKEYLKNEVEKNYAVISFDSAPKGSYIVIEYMNFETFSLLANILKLKPQEEIFEEKLIFETKDKKLERELDIISREVSGEDIYLDDEETDEDYEYIEFGERHCKVCGSVIRRITIQDKDGNIKDGYKCINTNCLKVYIIR